MLRLSLSSPLSLYSIPVVWFLAFYPAEWRTLLIDGTIGYDNERPRGNLSIAKANKLSPELISKLERLDGAHLNGNEAFPLWAAAIITANLVGVDNRTLNIASLSYVGLRLFYNTIYINYNNALKGWLRTAVFFTGLPIPLWLLVKSANKLT